MSVSGEMRSSIAAACKDLKRTVRTKEWLIDGSASIKELCYLAELASTLPGTPIIGEVGFNFGLSSLAFLMGNGAAQVVSFDIGTHDYVRPSKAIIDELFPGRHRLIFGDSLKRVPTYADTNPAVRFDLAFIDGGHAYEIAAGDIANMRRLSDSKTVLVFDDLVPWLPWGIGPTLAWRDARRQGVVVEDERRGDGILARRVWARGRYVF